MGGTGNKRFKELIVYEHHLRMFNEYTENNNLENALFHVDLSYKYEPEPREWSLNNNFGYVFIAADEREKARHALNKAIDMCSSNINYALTIYDLAILEAKENEYEKALENVKQAIKKLKGVNKQRRRMDCLFVPKIISGELKFEEVQKADLLEIAQEAKKVFEEVIDKKEKSEK